MLLILIIEMFFFFKSTYIYLATNRDGSITPRDFEILADKLLTLDEQENKKGREDYANVRRTFCQENMRADVNQDGKVTLGKYSNVSYNFYRTTFLFLEE